MFYCSDWAFLPFCIIVLCSTSSNNINRKMILLLSILKDNGMFQTNRIVCTKRQSPSQLKVRSAVITSVMPVLLCREMRGELFLSGAGQDTFYL